MERPVKPSDIMFSVAVVDNIFHKNSHHCYRPIGETLDLLCEDKIKISDIPTIVVVKRGTELITVNNRRLWIFRQMERLGKCITIPVLVTEEITLPHECDAFMNANVRESPGGLCYLLPSSANGDPLSNIIWETLKHIKENMFPPPSRRIIVTIFQNLALSPDLHVVNEANNETQRVDRNVPNSEIDMVSVSDTVSQHGLPSDTSERDEILSAASFPNSQYSLVTGKEDDNWDREQSFDDGEFDLEAVNCADIILETGGTPAATSEGADMRSTAGCLTSGHLFITGEENDSRHDEQSLDTEEHYSDAINCADKRAENEGIPAEGTEMLTVASCPTLGHLFVTGEAKDKLDNGQSSGTGELYYEAIICADKHRENAGKPADSSKEVEMLSAVSCPTSEYSFVTDDANDNSEKEQSVDIGDLDSEAISCADGYNNNKEIPLYNSKRVESSCPSSGYFFVTSDSNDKSDNELSVDTNEFDSEAIQISCVDNHVELMEMQLVTSERVEMLSESSCPSSGYLFITGEVEKNIDEQLIDTRECVSEAIDVNCAKMHTENDKLCIKRPNQCVIPDRQPATPSNNTGDVIKIDVIEKSKRTQQWLNDLSPRAHTNELLLRTICDSCHLVQEGRFRCNVHNEIERMSVFSTDGQQGCLHADTSEGVEMLTAASCQSSGYLFITGETGTNMDTKESNDIDEFLSEATDCYLVPGGRFRHNVHNEMESMSAFSTDSRQGSLPAETDEMLTAASCLTSGYLFVKGEMLTAASCQSSGYLFITGETGTNMDTKKSNDTDEFLSEATDCYLVPGGRFRHNVHNEMEKMSAFSTDSQQGSLPAETDEMLSAASCPTSGYLFVKGEADVNWDSCRSIDTEDFVSEPIEANCTDKHSENEKLELKRSEESVIPDGRPAKPHEITRDIINGIENILSQEQQRQSEFRKHIPDINLFIEKCIQRASDSNNYNCEYYETEIEALKSDINSILFTKNGEIERLRQVVIEAKRELQELQKNQTRLFTQGKSNGVNVCTQTSEDPNSSINGTSEGILEIRNMPCYFGISPWESPYPAINGSRRRTDSEATITEATADESDEIQENEHDDLDLGIYT